MEKITVSLAADLKNAGFPQDQREGETVEYEGEQVYLPTEDELDEAFENTGPADRFILGERDGLKTFSYRGQSAGCTTLIDAKANVWIRIYG